MKTPSEFQIEQLMHFYDPAKAHEYYERTKKLKGRKPGKGDSTNPREPSAKDPRTGKSRNQIAKSARARQRKELAEAIDGLEGRLKKLEALIKQRAHDEASEDRKSKAKKERSAKEKDKPKSAAEKAEAARENEKYREKNQQKLKNDSKKRDDKSSGGSSSKSKSSNSKHSVSELKSLATKVRGQIAVAKQKLAAL